MGRASRCARPGSHRDVFAWRFVFNSTMGGGTQRVYTVMCSGGVRARRERTRAQSHWSFLHAKRSAGPDETDLVCQAVHRSQLA